MSVKEPLRQLDSATSRPDCWIYERVPTQAFEWVEGTVIIYNLNHKRLITLPYGKLQMSVKKPSPTAWQCITPTLRPDFWIYERVPTQAFEWVKGTVIIYNINHKWSRTLPYGKLQMSVKEPSPTAWQGITPILRPDCWIYERVPTQAFEGVEGTVIIYN